MSITIFESMRLSTFILALFISFMVVEPAIASIVDQFESCSVEDDCDSCECTCNPFMSCDSCAGFYPSKQIFLSASHTDLFATFATPLENQNEESVCDIFRPPICLG